MHPDGPTKHKELGELALKAKVPIKINESDAYAQGSHTYQHPMRSAKRHEASATPATASAVGSWDDFMAGAV